jgi:hypothetical protein
MTRMKMWSLVGCACAFACSAAFGAGEAGPGLPEAVRGDVRSPTAEELRERIGYDLLPPEKQAIVDARLRRALGTGLRGRAGLGGMDAEAMAFFLHKRLPPGVDYPIERVRAIADAERAEAAMRHGAMGLRGDDEDPVPILESWSPMGPGNIGGRTRALVVSPDGPGSLADPGGPGFMLAGGVAGGVFKSDDGGVSWRSVSGPMDNLAIGALAIDPKERSGQPYPYTIWAGTGESYEGRDGDQVPGQNGPIGLRGLGLYKSEDGGESWEIVSETNFPCTGEQSFRFVNDIAISPRLNDDQEPRIYVATTTGLWLNRDGGVDENPPTDTDDNCDADDWFVVLPGNVTDVAVEPSPLMGSPGDDEEEIVFAAVGSREPGGLWVSNTAGETWFRVGDEENGVTGEDVLTRIDTTLQGRMSIDILAGDTLNDAWIYVLMSRRTTGITMLPLEAQGIPAGAVVNVFRARLSSLDEVTKDDDDNGNGELDVIDINLDFEAVLARDNAGNNVNSLLLSDALFSGACSGATYPTLSVGDFANVIRVEPGSDTDQPGQHRVWVGGVDLFRSDDGGANFGVASYWYADPPAGPVGVDLPATMSDESGQGQALYVHENQHAIVFPPDFDPVGNPVMYVGNDGGIFRTDDARAAVVEQACPFFPDGAGVEVRWDPTNSGYDVTQFYHGDTGNWDWPLPSVDQDDKAANVGRDLIVGGTEGGGLVRQSRRGCVDRWEQIASGTAGYVAVDPRTNNRMYVSGTGFGNIFRLERDFAGNEELEFISDGLGPDVGLYVAPFTLDPSDPSVMWAGGRQMWRTTNADAANPEDVVWEAIGRDGNDPTADDPFDFPGAREASAIAVAPSDSNYVYVAFENGYVYRTTNALDAPEDVVWEDVSAGLPNAAGEFSGIGFLSSLAVDPDDPEVVWVTNSRFVLETNTTAHVFRRGEYMVGGGPQTFFQAFDGFTDCDPTDDIDPQLPDVPVNWVALRKCAGSDCTLIGGEAECLVFLGTDIGVFVSDNAWAIDEECDPDGDGTGVDTIGWTLINTPDVLTGGSGELPRAMVSSLDFRDENTMVAFTYGRGAWLAELADDRACDGEDEIPCSPADVVTPFGLVDLADLTSFVQDFERQRLAADIACGGTLVPGEWPCEDPACGDGLVDLSDLTLFVALFQAGCP